MKICELIKKYSENPAELEKILDGVVIHATAKVIPGIRIIGGTEHPYRRYEIKVERKGKEISFEYGGSVKDYQEEKSSDKNRELSGSIYNLPNGEHLAYSVLCCMGSDGMIDFSSLDAFCNELGYSPDSKNDTELYIECVKQHRKIRSLFNEDELITFPR